MREGENDPKLSLERYRVEKDIELRARELSLRESEAEENKIRREKHRRVSFSPKVTTIIATITAILGGLIGSIIQGHFNLKLEDEKRESSLILAAIETGSIEDSRRNLLFLVDIGFLEDETGNIKSLRDNPENTPVLPPKTPPDAWFAVVGSFLHTELEEARSHAKRVSEQLANANILVTVEIYRTIISRSYAVVIGGVLSRTEAIELSAMARNADIQEDAFAQENRGWVFVERTK
jgi:hypothetical protein